jgi:hypothetical protein
MPQAKKKGPRPGHFIAGRRPLAICRSNAPAARTFSLPIVLAPHFYMVVSGRLDGINLAQPWFVNFHIGASSGVAKERAMKSCITWKFSGMIVLLSAMLALESPITAQTLPEPAGDEPTLALPPPATEARQPAAPEVDDPALTAPPAEPALQGVQIEPAGRATLGVTLDPRYRRSAVVRSVAPGSAAEHAGIEPGDTIEALNGNRVTSYYDVLEFVDSMRPGDVIDIDFARRITGRTQAVLDGSSPQAGAGVIGPAAPAANGVAQAADERLPAPPYSARRVPADMRPEDDARDRPSADNRADQDDQRQRRGFFNRARGRGLLPWRRN